jgi:hypothetical protein
MIVDTQNRASSENSEQSQPAEANAADEERFIAAYRAMTGASEAQARSAYMYADIARRRDPYSYHLE